MSLEIRIIGDPHNTLDLDFTTATQLIRARSQIPVLGLTGRALGLPGSLKLPGASAVYQSYKQWRSQGLPGWATCTRGLAHPEGRNEEENENSLRKSKKT